MNDETLLGAMRSSGLSREDAQIAHDLQLHAILEAQGTLYRIMKTAPPHLQIIVCMTALHGLRAAVDHHIANMDARLGYAPKQDQADGT